MDKITNTGLENTTGTTATTATAKASGMKALGKEDFMKMLLAQLKNQDPLKPLDGTDFTAQLAQFSSLEQLSNLNTEIKAQSVNQMTIGYTQSVNMIGKEIIADLGGEPTTGTVTAVHFRGSQILVTVNDQEIPITSITQVKNPVST